jgi:hypothetical protein
MRYLFDADRQTPLFSSLLLLAVDGIVLIGGWDWAYGRELIRGSGSALLVS